MTAATNAVAMQRTSTIASESSEILPPRNTPRKRQQSVAAHPATMMNR